MTNEEAKIILRSYRSSGKDARDPHFAEALEQLKRDPELARWYAEETAANTKLAEKLREAARPPAHLRSAILASAKVIDVRPRWRRYARLEAAAAILAAAVVASLMLDSARGERRLAEFQNQMHAFVAEANPEMLDLREPDFADIKRWLTEHSGPADFVVPAGLNDKQTMGCKVLDFRGSKVTFVCFRGENRELVHLFVADRAKFSKPPPASPLWARRGNITTAIWSDTRHVYFATLAGDEQALRRYL